MTVLLHKDTHINNSCWSYASSSSSLPDYNTIHISCSFCQRIMYVTTVSSSASMGLSVCSHGRCNDTHCMMKVDSTAVSFRLSILAWHTTTNSEVLYTLVQMPDDHHGTELNETKQSPHKKHCDIVCTLQTKTLLPLHTVPNRAMLTTTASQRSIQNRMAASATQSPKSIHAIQPKTLSSTSVQ